MRPNQAARSRTSVGSVALVMAAIGINFLLGGCTPSPDAGTGVPTNAQPSAGSDRIQALMLAQVPLLAAADRIKALDPQGLGLGGLRVDIEQRTLEVWWKGDPPQSVREEIALQERNAGIRVPLRSSPHAQRELVELTRSIVQRAGEYPGLVSAGPLVDGSGLEIGVLDPARAVSFKFPVPVRIVAAQQFVPLSRAADSPPWSVGAVTKTSNFANAPSFCSTGFAMAGAFGRQGMLTADHCACGGNVAFFTGSGLLIGMADPDRKPPSPPPYTDSLLIGTAPPGTPGATIWLGGVGIGEVQFTVVGRASNVVGMRTCTSGAGTGLNCGIQIDAVNQVLPNNVPGASLGGFCPYLPFIQGVSVGHQIAGPLRVAAGQGNSGGSVFTFATTPRAVNAAGMIIGGDHPILCDNGAFRCFNRVAFHDVDTLEWVQNAFIFPGTPSSGPTQAGGATTISMVVFGGADRVVGFNSALATISIQTAAEHRTRLGQRPNIGYARPACACGTRHPCGCFCFRVPPI